MDVLRQLRSILSPIGVAEGFARKHFPNPAVKIPFTFAEELNRRVEVDAKDLSQTPADGTETIEDSVSLPVQTPVETNRPPIVLGQPDGPTDVPDAQLPTDDLDEPPPAPSTPVPAPGSKCLGTRSEYMLDGDSAKGTSFRGLAVRYWDVYSDGTKILREDWSSWTGTVDSSLANTDLIGGNVVGLEFRGTPPSTVA